MEQVQLAAHLGSQPGIEVTKRLIQEKNAGLAHQGTAQGCPLLLASRELMRIAFQHVPKLQQTGSPLNPFRQLLVGLSSFV
jgi:hypothetical protein